MGQVFVSYPSEYATEAARLVSDLRRLGHDVWWDIERIDVGDSIVEALNKGISKSSHVILCLGESDRSTPWRDTEWMSAFALQLSGAKIRLLPAAITPGPRIPPILADRAYADLASDWPSALLKLHRAIQD